MRKAGILMPVSCLPSPYGIGDFGESAYAFLDWMKEVGFSIWQILPLNPLGKGNSPYQPISSYAMDEIYISPSILFEQGLLPSLPKEIPFTKQIDYAFVRKYKEEILQEAISHFEKEESFLAFQKQFSVFGYTLYKQQKKKTGCDWTYWKKEVEIDSWEEIEKEMIIQYLLRIQWEKIHQYAKDLGITILGDLPFYVGLDGSDVWLNQESFLLKEDGSLEYVAGVPGDYFNPDGQKWGNPLYRWDVLQENGFSFWVNRIKAVGEIYDQVRIDHFRALDTYWKIPSDAETANQGEWVEAPGYDCLSTIKKEVPEVELVAEDLGFLREEVYQLRDRFQLKGMRIVQYSLDHLEFVEDPPQRIIYSGTHDNMPLKPWFELLSEDVRIPLQEELFQRGYQEETIVKSILSYVLDSQAEDAMVSIVDVLEKDAEARINAPGTMGGHNWSMHLESLEELKSTTSWLKEKIEKTGRKNHMD